MILDLNVRDNDFCSQSFAGFGAGGVGSGKEQDEYAKKDGPTSI